MGLKGNLGSVDLANIFQMLSINQKEGTLIIHDGHSRKSIYFSRDGVSMLSRGKVRQDSLGRILLRYNRITSDQLQRALEKQSSSNRLLGEILEEMTVVSRTDVENALRVQIEEEIYNLFIWKNAEFEFVEGDPSQVFDDLERPITKLTFNVNALIMEAARRIDEWEYISARITSTRDIFRFTGKRADLSDEIFQSPFAENVLQCVDGRSNILEVVERSYVNKFEVCKLLAILFDQGAIEPVPVEDLRTLAAQAAQEHDDEGVVKFLQRVLDEGELDANLHHGLAEAFENLGELEKATCHHKLFAESRLEEGHTEDALRAYAHVRDVLPTDLFGRERRLEVLLEHGGPDNLDPREVVDEAREVANILAEIGQVRKAVTVLARAVQVAPDDLEARNQLAGLDLQAGFTAEAITEYRHIAAAKRSARDHEGAAKIYRRILAIDRGQEEVLEELESLVSDKKHRSAQRRRVFLTAVVTVLAGVAVYAVLLYELRARGSFERGEQEAQALLTSHETAARKALGRLEEELSRLHHRPDPDPVRHLEQTRHARETSDRSVASVIEMYELVIERFPYSSSRNQAAERIEELEAIRDRAADLERTASRQVQDKAVEQFVIACQVSSAGQLTDALERYREALRLATDPKWIDSPGVELNDRIRQHESILREAEQVHARAGELERAGRVGEAAEILLRLLKTHSYQEITEKIRIPLAVTSQPSGARIVLTGQDPVTTPATIRFSPRSGIRGRLEAPGFEPTPFEVAPLDLDLSLEEIRRGLPSQVHVDLKKGYRWRTQAGGPLECEPLVVDGGLVVGSRGGHLLRVSLGDGQILWSMDLPALGGVTTTPVAWKDLLLVTTSNPNALLAVDPTERRILWRFDSSKGLGGIAVRPVLSGDDLLMSDSHGYVYCIALDRENPRLRWRVRPGGEIRAGLVPTGDTILAPSLDGRIYELEPTRGLTRKTIRVGSPITAPPVLSGNLLLVCSRDGKLRAMDRESGVTEWIARAGGEIRAAPVIFGSRILFTSLDGVLRVVGLRDGLPIATYRTSGPLAAAPVVSNGHIYVTGHDGYIHALVLSGNGIVPRWSYRTGARVDAGAVRAGDHVLVASHDGFLYALSP